MFTAIKIILSKHFHPEVKCPTKHNLIKPFYSGLLNESYRNRVGRCGMDSSGSKQEHVASSCEQINEPLGPIKGEEFLD
jgi:hypothetical protein